METRPSSPALHVGGVPLVQFANPDPAFADWLTRLYGPNLGAGNDAPVVVRTAAIDRRGPWTRLRLHNLRTAGDEGGRFFLCDEHGAAAQLPADGSETELGIDTGFQPSWAGTYVHRLLEWQALRHDMLVIHAGGVVLPGGAIVVSGFPGSGKSSVVLSLLERATGFLGPDRVVLAGPGEVAGLANPIELSLGRFYSLPPAVGQALSPFERRRMQLAQAALRAAPGRLKGRLRRELDDRFFLFEARRAYPSLPFPPRARLASLVFLLRRSEGEIEVSELDAEEALTRAEQPVRYIHGSFVSPFETMFTSLFPQRRAWPAVPLDASVDRLRALLEGVRAWAVRVPEEAPSAEIASAVRSTIT